MKFVVCMFIITIIAALLMFAAVSIHSGEVTSTEIVLGIVITFTITNLITTSFCLIFEATNITTIILSLIIGFIAASIAFIRVRQLNFKKLKALSK